MKDRILRLLRKCGLKDYYKVWSKGRTYESEIKIEGHCHEWVYLNWALMIIHLNVLTDKITIYVDQKKIAE